MPTTQVRREMGEGRGKEAPKREGEEKLLPCKSSFAFQALLMIMKCYDNTIFISFFFLIPLNQRVLLLATLCGLGDLCSPTKD